VERRAPPHQQAVQEKQEDQGRVDQHEHPPMICGFPVGPRSAKPLTCNRQE
jgi:hypothetical protein